jgi:hypothetical protein
LREARITHDDEARVILTEAQLDALADYVRMCRAELGLAEWHLIIGRHEPAVADNGDVPHAEVIPTDGRYVAYLRFSDAFWRLPAIDQREAVTHELVHLLHVGVTEPVRAGHWRQLAGLAAADGLWVEVKRQAEYMTDKLASILAPYLPMPDLPRPPHSGSSNAPLATPDAAPDGAMAGGG